MTTGAAIDLAGKSARDLEDSAPRARTLYRYKIPTSLHLHGGGIVELGFVELTPDEELMAAKRAGQPMRLAFEMAMESMREVGMSGLNGVVKRSKLSTGDGTADRVWHQMHPKLRTLAVTAYGELHNPKDSEAASFLESREVSAG